MAEVGKGSFGEQVKGDFSGLLTRDMNLKDG